MVATPQNSRLFAEAPISDEGRARALRDEAAARAAGFSLKNPIYAIGTTVNETGTDNFRQSRADWEALPPAREAAAALATQVEAETRHDVLVEAWGTRMLSNGLLESDAGVLPLSERGFDGLCRLVTPGGARYLASCPLELRADNVNHWLARAYTEGKDHRRKPKKLTLRTRDAAEREIFAVVGPKYPGDAGIDVIATRLWRTLPEDARGEVLYDGYRARVDALFHSDIRPDAAVAGEVFKAGVRITSSDDGTGAAKVEAIVWRNLCRNLIIIDCATKMVTRRRHVGARIADDVEYGIVEALRKVEHFRSAWTTATLENVVERYGFGDVPALLRALVEQNVVEAAGVDDETLADRLISAWYAEPGYSKSDIVNAISRVAHTSTWTSWTTGEELERRAGELLFARVWNVSAAEVA